MKTLYILLFFFIYSTTFAQITDTYGKSAVDVNGSSLSGNIGIGTNNPSEKLHVSFGNILLDGDADGELQIKFNDLDTNNFWRLEASPSHESFLFRVNNSNIMTLTNTMNVGIGTLNPDEKLAVNGTIHAKEVRVDLIGWPDYVFNKNYKLSSLKEVENYIKKNGHLQSIPSAKIVEEKGVKLGEMNKLLLQKIEELTLYTIEQQKMIKQLQHDVAAIKTKND